MPAYAHVVLTDGPAGTLVAAVFSEPPPDEAMWEAHTGAPDPPRWMRDDTVVTRNPEGRIVMLDATEAGGPRCWVVESPVEPAGTVVA